jgi:hypothetical protein
MSRLVVFVVVVAAWLISSWSAGESLGTSSACENSKCVVTASSSLIAIVMSIALSTFALTYRQLPAAPNDARIVGVWRRFGAFLLDFTAVVMVVSSIGAIPMLLAEGHFTGQFHWSFSREFSRPTDAVIVLPIALACFLVLFGYFYGHARADRQTLGQYVLGYRVMAANEQVRPAYGKRVLLSFVGLCMWPISVILAMRKPHKDFWWDSATDSRVVRVGT